MYFFCWCVFLLLLLFGGRRCADIEWCAGIELRHGDRHTVSAVPSATIWLLGAFFGTWSRAKWCLLMAQRRDLSTLALPSCLTSWLMETASFHGLQCNSFRLFPFQPHCQPCAQASAKFCNGVTIGMTLPALTDLPTTFPCPEINLSSVIMAPLI